jgi:hypothetical protein
MDQLDIGLMALSADIDRAQFQSGVRFDSLSDRLLDAQEAAARAGRVLLFGEFELRHYP